MTEGSKIVNFNFSIISESRALQHDYLTQIIDRNHAHIPSH